MWHIGIKAHRTFVGKHQGKRPFGALRHRWKGRKFSN